MNQEISLLQTKLNNVNNDIIRERKTSFAKLEDLQNNFEEVKKEKLQLQKELTKEKEMCYKLKRLN